MKWITRILIILNMCAGITSSAWCFEYTDPFAYDTASPDGVITVDSVKGLTANLNLTDVADNGGEGTISSMQFSNDGSNFSPAPPASYADNYHWVLETGPGLKTIYGYFVDMFGNSATLSTNAEVPDTVPEMEEIITLTTIADTPKYFTLNANDPDGTSEFSYQVATQPDNGSLRITGSKAIYTASPDFTGVDTFSIQVSDGLNLSEPLTISVTVVEQVHTIETSFFIMGNTTLQPILKYGNSTIEATGTWQFHSLDETQATVDQSGSVTMVGNQGTEIEITYDDPDIKNPEKVSVFAFPDFDNINEIEFENNNNPENATPHKFLPTIGELTDKEDIDYFKITLDKGRFLNVFFNNPENYADYELTLLSENLKDLWSETSENGNNLAWLNIPLDQGNYLIKIESGEDLGSDYYTIILSKGDSLEQNLDPDNNTLQKALVLAVDNETQGRFLSKSESDYYKLSVSRPSHLSLNFYSSSPANQYEAALYASGILAGFSTTINFDNGLPSTFSGNWQIQKSEDQAQWVMQSVPFDQVCSPQEQVVGFESQIPAGFSGTWIRDESSATPDGRWALQSAPVDDDQQSSIEIQAVSGTSISFYYRVSSEEYDELQFLIDDQVKLTDKGDTGWKEFKVDVTAGEHRFRWIYRKDASVTERLDTAWIDQLNLGDIESCDYPPSNMEAMVITQPQVSFRYRRVGDDLQKSLEFYVDEQLRQKLCDNIDCNNWNTHTINVSKGYHSFRWVVPGSESDTFFQIDNFGKLVNNNLLSELSWNTSVQKSASLPISLQAGDYYLELKSSEVDLKNLYTVSLFNEEASSEFEPNNTVYSPNTIKTDQTVQGLLSTEFDEDYYAFYQPSDAMFSFDFIPEKAGTSFSIRILNEDEGVLNEWLSTGGESLEDRKLGLRQGNYYLHIQPQSNSLFDPKTKYSLKVISAIESINKLSSLIITYDEEPQLNTPLPLQVTAYYLDGTSQDVTHSEGLQWILSNTSLANITSEGELTLLESGTLTVKASYGGEIGKITFQSSGENAIQDYGNLILVAGGGIASSNNLRTATQYLSNLVYRHFLKRGFENKDIYYFNPSSEHDLNGDGIFDKIVDENKVTVENFAESITTWAVNQPSTGPLYLYFNDHGGVDKFQLFPGENMTASDLNTWITQFQNDTTREVVIIFEACKSGSFVDDLQGSNRLILTSSNQRDSYLSHSGTISFSQSLFSRLAVGDTFESAFEHASNFLKNVGRPYYQQKPQWNSGNNDLTNLRIGGEFTTASLEELLINETTASGNINANVETPLFALVEGLENITQVSAVITPPDYIPPNLTGDLESPEVSLPVVILRDEDNNKFLDGRYEGVYTFLLNGVYQVIFYANDEDNNVVASPAIFLTVNDGKDTVIWNLMSFPEATGQTPDEFFSADKDKINAVWSWSDNNWAIWSPDQDLDSLNQAFGNTNFVLLESINAAQGYWVNSNNFIDPLSTCVTDSETPCPTANRPVMENKWNLTGFNESLTMDEVMLEYPNAISVWSWEGNSWNAFFKNEIDTTFTKLKQVEPGKGYWIRLH